MTAPFTSPDFTTVRSLKLLGKAGLRDINIYTSNGFRVVHIDDIPSPGNATPGVLLTERYNDDVDPFVSRLLNVYIVDGEPVSLT